jgi:hypothetical protein
MAEVESLAERRAREREQKEQDLEAPIGSGDDDAGAQSLDELEGEQPVGEEPDGQMFVWEQGRKVTLGTLIARGTDVEHAFVFGGKRLKGAGSLMGLDEDVLVVVRGKPSEVRLVPTRDDQERVTKVTIETHVAVKVLAAADSEQAVGMLAGALERRGWQRTAAA